KWLDPRSQLHCLGQDKVFHVGDVLVFNYTKNKHNVITVNGTAFKNCTIPPNGAHNTSLDRIKLQAPGKKWYICGIADHCAEHGMKLVIDVQGAAPPPAPNHTAPPPAPIHKAPPPAPNHTAPPPAPNHTAPAPAPNHTAPRTFSGYQIIASALILVAMVMA
ncbi:hypothetical protein NMG60_11001599, partial [Bertholletia excelsa]